MDDRKQFVEVYNNKNEESFAIPYRNTDRLSYHHTTEVGNIESRGNGIDAYNDGKNIENTLTSIQNTLQTSLSPLQEANAIKYALLNPDYSNLEKYLWDNDAKVIMEKSLSEFYDRICEECDPELSNRLMSSILNNEELSKEDAAEVDMLIEKFYGKEVVEAIQQGLEENTKLRMEEIISSVDGIKPLETRLESAMEGSRLPPKIKLDTPEKPVLER